MKDYFLRADNREAIDQALQTAGLLFYVDGELVTPIDVVVYHVGKVIRPTGRMLTGEEGNEYPEEKPIEGYHVNLRAALTPEQEALLPIIPEPANPQAIFAGGILR